MVRDNRHESAYLFGAVCPARGIGAAIVVPRVCSEVMTEHLAEIATQVSQGHHAVLVCDGAGWHHSGARLTVPRARSILLDRSRALEIIESTERNPLTLIQCERTVL